MFLGIEIGGTKLQLGVGAGDGAALAALQRFVVNPKRGAGGILEQIERAAGPLAQKHGVTRVGVGFGGPVLAASGTVLTSHQIDGWDDFPLGAWCRRALNLPTRVGNDCDAAALAEARHGAGRGARSVFYVTVGTGVGGGLVLDGRLHGQGRPAAAEIGHMRPGLHADRPESTVESLASGWGLAAAAQARLSGAVSRPIETVKRLSAQRGRELADSDAEHGHDLLNRCDGDVETLTAKMVVEAAADGNLLAQDVLRQGTQALGWAVAQVITLLAVEVVVVGGGVSLAGEALFFAPLREQVERYVFPPLRHTYEIAPAALGELAVVHGAIALAAE